MSFARTQTILPPVVRFDLDCLADGEDAYPHESAMGRTRISAKRPPRMLAHVWVAARLG